MTENELAIHKTLGPGLLESVYEEALIYELKKLGIQVERQAGIPVMYDDVKMDIGFRADVLVENRLIVELKSIESILPIHNKMLLTYLRLANMKLGLLVNFNVDLIKDGIFRIANGL